MCSKVLRATEKHWAELGVQECLADWDVGWDFKLSGQSGPRVDNGIWAMTLELREFAMWVSWKALQSGTGEIELSMMVEMFSVLQADTIALAARGCWAYEMWLVQPKDKTFHFT